MFVSVLTHVVGLVGLQELVQLSQEGLAVHAVDHAGLFNGLAPGRGAAQAVHTDGKEQRRSLRGYIQNIADNGFFFNFNSHVQLSYSATLTKDDTAVFISNTGKTQEILQALEAVQASGCHTIGITHYSKSPLSAGCKLLLYTSSKEVYVRSGAMSSRLAQLMVVDALFTVLASQDYAAIQGTLESSYQICMSHRVDHR